MWEKLFFLHSLSGEIGQEKKPSGCANYFCHEKGHVFAEKFAYACDFLFDACIQ